MSSVGLAFRRGVGTAIRLWRGVALMSLANLGLAILGGLPSSETESAPSVAHAGPVILLESIDAALSGNLLGLDRSLLGLGLVYMLLNTFFAAGVLGVARADARGNRLAEFCAAGARNYPRFLRLLAGSVLVYGLALGWLGTARFGLDEALRDVSSDKPVVFVSLGYAASLALALGSFRLLIDYTRVALVLNPAEGVLASLATAARFLARYPRRTLGLYCALGLTGMVGIAGFAVTDAALEPHGLGLRLMSFSLQQGFIFFAIEIRATAWCAELLLYRSTEPPETRSPSERLGRLQPSL